MAKRGCCKQEKAKKEIICTDQDRVSWSVFDMRSILPAGPGSTGSQCGKVSGEIDRGAALDPLVGSAAGDSS